MIRLLRENLMIYSLRLGQAARTVVRDAGFELLLKRHSGGHCNAESAGWSHQFLHIWR